MKLNAMLKWLRCLDWHRSDGRTRRERRFGSGERSIDKLGSRGIGRIAERKRQSTPRSVSVNCSEAEGRNGKLSWIVRGDGEKFEVKVACFAMLQRGWDDAIGGLTQSCAQRFALMKFFCRALVRTSRGCSGGSFGGPCDVGRYSGQEWADSHW